MNLEIEKSMNPKSFRQQKRWIHELRFGKIKYNRPVNVVVDGRLEERLKIIQFKKKKSMNHATNFMNCNAGYFQDNFLPNHPWQPIKANNSS